MIKKILGFNTRDYSPVPRKDRTKELPVETEEEIRRVLQYIQGATAFLHNYSEHVVCRFTTLWAMINYDQRWDPPNPISTKD